MSTSSLYQQFLSQLGEVQDLKATLSLLDWDMKVYMPSGGAIARSGQLATLASIIHERKTNAHFVEVVFELEARSDLDSNQRVNVREVAKELRRLLRVPKSLVYALTECASATHLEWLDARKADDFALVKDSLEKLVHMKLEYAQLIAEERSAYDALVDLYEPGMTAAEIDVLFGDLRVQVREILQQILDKVGPGGMPSVARAIFPKEQQKEFCRLVVENLGFDFSRGRMDETVHPFCCELSVGDVRITTRYNEEDIDVALFACLHEAGHAMYEQGILAEHVSTPLGEACSLGIHESQSLLWERHVGQSREFLSYLFPQLCNKFPAALKEVSHEEYYRYVNQVRPSLNRVEADEVTYSLHVILRFEIEKALFSDQVKVADLAEIWNEKYYHYLGLKPSSDFAGILQDIHWYSGAFGYFPTYTLGAIYAAQLFSAFEQFDPGTPELLVNGKFGALKAWLNKTIHQHGRRYPAKELITKATGMPLNIKPYVKYLKKKYGELYQLNYSVS